MNLIRNLYCKDVGLVSGFWQVIRVYCLKGFFQQRKGIEDESIELNVRARENKTKQ